MFFFIMPLKIANVIAVFLALQGKIYWTINIFTSTVMRKNFLHPSKIQKFVGCIHAFYFPAEMDRHFAH